MAEEIELIGATALRDPDPATARHLLRELDWGEHFIGVEMNPTGGNNQVYLYGMKEAVKYLQYGSVGLGLSTGGKGTMGWVDFERFSQWVRNEIGDADLADAIDRDVPREPTFRDQIHKLGGLVSTRYAQLCDVVAVEEAS